jgi:hypothetical protein
MKSTSLAKSPKSESIFFRILLALPLLGLFLSSRKVLGANVSHYLPVLEEAAKTGWIDDGGNLIPLRTTYSGVKGLDGFLSIFVGFFTPALAGLDHCEQNHSSRSTSTDTQKRPFPAPNSASSACSTHHRDCNQSLSSPTA